MSQENSSNKNRLVRFVNRQQMSWRAVDVERLIGEDHCALNRKHKDKSKSQLLEAHEGLATLKFKGPPIKITDDYSPSSSSWVVDSKSI